MSLRSIISKISMVSLMFLVPLIGFAQEVEIEIKEDVKEKTILSFKVEIDPDRFKEKTKNTYWDSEGEGMIHVSLREQKYEDFKSHIGKMDLGLIHIIEEKEISLNEILFLYCKQEQDRAGTVFEMVSYIKKWDINSVIEVGAIYPKGDERKYKNIVQNAAISAKLIE